MSDALDPRDEIEGEYTDSELPLDAELPKDETEALRDADDDAVVDDVEVIEVDRDDTGRSTSI